MKVVARVALAKWTVGRLASRGVASCGGAYSSGKRENLRPRLYSCSVATATKGQSQAVETSVNLTMGKHG
jgi:hypothetical protein